MRPHDLRHSAISLWIASGANPKVVHAKAGHASIRVTYDRYGHLFPDYDDRATRHLEELWDSESSQTNVVALRSRQDKVSSHPPSLAGAGQRQAQPRPGTAGEDDMYGSP